MACKGCKKARDRLLAARSPSEVAKSVEDAIRVNADKAKAFWSQKQKARKGGR